LKGAGFKPIDSEYLSTCALSGTLFLITLHSHSEADSGRLRESNLAMNHYDSKVNTAQFYGNVLTPKAAALADFRRRFPEKTFRDGAVEWRYRVIGSAAPALLAIPGGELVNDLGFEFALAMSGCCRIVYPAYPRVDSIEQLAGGLRAILDAEKISQTAILGASFGGALAQVFVRKYPERISHLILSNCGVPLRYLVPSVRVFSWIAEALPWSATAALLRRSMPRALAATGEDRAFWSAYFDELFSIRITKADLLANLRIQLDYHRRFHFTPRDLEDWKGKILIAESDTDVISPRRRQALRQTYPNALVHTYQNGGHATMFLCFDEYLAMVKQFLDTE
jgi:pimeloyl-ACP methyl ester carboxylesterase